MKLPTLRGTDGISTAQLMREPPGTIERSIVFPLANLVATGQVATGERIDIGLSPEGKMTFTKVVAVKGKTLAAG